MIAVIAGEASASGGLMHLALEHGGFEAHDAATPEEASRIVEAHGSACCVLTIDARRLSASGDDAHTWASFLDAHPALGAVVTLRAPANDAVRKATGGENRLLLENPFDAAAVVAGMHLAARAEPVLARVRRPADRAGRKSGARPSAAS